MRQCLRIGHYAITDQGKGSAALVRLCFGHCFQCLGFTDSSHQKNVRN